MAIDPSDVDVTDLDGVLPIETPPLEEGSTDLSIKAHGKQGAMTKAQEWVRDLAEVGVKAHVEYNGVELAEENTVTEGGAVHSVKLVIEEDTLAD